MPKRNARRSSIAKYNPARISVVLAALVIALASVMHPAIALAQDRPSQEDKPNSWRYVDGVPISETEALSLTSETNSIPESGTNTDTTTPPEETEPAFVSWSETPAGFINSKGALIEGALRKGIDVSEWNKSIDWAAVASSDIDYAIIRCGYGDDLTSQDDKYFLDNVRGCLENDIPFGVYIYSYAYNEKMAASEAAHVLRLLEEADLSPADLGYPVYYDLEEQGHTSKPCIRERNPKYVEGLDEDGDGEEDEPKYIYNYLDNETLALLATTFATAIEEAGYKVGIYANLNWWNNHLTDPAFDQWERWVAQYYHQCNYQGSYAMWQCTSSGSVNGISTRVDLNFDYDLNRCAPVLPDIDVTDWYYTNGSYTYVMSRELITGYSSGKNAGKFGPYHNITRGQVATILWRMAGEPEAQAQPFEDVDYSEYYGPAIHWARATGVVNGHKDTDGVYRKFKPDAQVTRQELVCMFANYAQFVDERSIESDGTTMNERPDADKVSSWAAPSMAWAIEQGILNGKNRDGVYYLAPKDKAWRASMATMIMNYLLLPAD